MTRSVPRTLQLSSAFKRDLKKAHRQGKNIAKLNRVLEILRHDKPLPDKYRPHPLTGNWSGFLECHIEPDWLLIYACLDDTSLHLARLGSHSELF